MKTYLFPLLALLLTQMTKGEDPKEISRQMVVSAMERELQQSTDIAIIEPVPAGGYRVITVLKGDRFATIQESAIHGVTHSMVGRIRDDLRGEAQLLVWQSGENRSPIGKASATPLLGAAPLSAAGDVLLSSGFKVSVASLSLKPRVIYVTTRGESDTQE